MVAEFKTGAGFVVVFGVLGVAGADGEADGAGIGGVDVEFFNEIAVFEFDGEGVADFERFFEGAEGDGFFEAVAVGVEAEGAAVGGDAVEVAVVDVLGDEVPAVGAGGVVGGLGDEFPFAEAVAAVLAAAPAVVVFGVGGAIVGDVVLLGEERWVWGEREGKGE